MLISDNLQQEILSILNEWNYSILSTDSIPSDIVALNFGLQKVWDSYEIYLEGFSWYDKDDEIWMLDVNWSPKYNFISLSKEFLRVDTNELLKIYNSIILKQIHSVGFNIPKQIQAVTVSLANGKPIKII